MLCHSNQKVTDTGREGEAIENNVDKVRLELGMTDREGEEAELCYSYRK